MPLANRKLGRSGLKVPSLCLGTLNFGWKTEPAVSVRMIHRALDAGIHFLDSADYYNEGRSEEIVGQAVKDRRNRVILTSKVFWPTGEGPNDRGTSRYHLLQSVETSLRRLQTDYIDLLLLHRPDPETPVDESLRTLDSLVKAGKVRYVGVSEFPAWQIVEALWVSDRLLLEPVVVTETLYNLVHRRPEKEIVPMGQKHGVGLMCYGALAFGLLTGKYRLGEPFPEESRGASRNWPADHPVFRRDWERSNQLASLAREAGYEPTAFALAWLLGQPGVTSVLLGPRTEEHLDLNLKALEIDLSAELLKAIDQISPPGGDW